MDSLSVSAKQSDLLTVDGQVLPLSPPLLDLQAGASCSLMHSVSLVRCNTELN